MLHPHMWTCIWHLWKRSLSKHNYYFKNTAYYICDILVLWDGEKANLQLFHDFINNMEGNLKFTCTADTEKLNFLDVRLIREVKGGN
ncbi:hypothetical protein XELAEV_18030347mg [Xenopus laevis]|uniref:Uncharacterized protein n=1 Tax=Xenopus laevis TaxID=8355 RepID=A0A974CKN1_XENLA|nr:hypothetical protein XELAEV_18030347mg [Xenopus laevis]